MKFDYEEQTEKIAEFRLTRFKNGISGAKEGAVLSLEKERKEIPNKPFFLILRSEATKVSLYQALCPPKTKLEHFMGRQENWKLWVLALKKRDKLVTEKELLKIQFESAEEALRFEELLGHDEPQKSE